MASSGPDLFVVCKSCGSEVSPYVTECPYCGTRVRKRAPKLDTASPGRRGPTMPSLGKLRSGEIPGIRGDETRKPYATLVLVIAAGLVSALITANSRPVVDFFAADDPLRLVAGSFVYLETGYEAAALVSIGLFGWLLERRYGVLAPLLVYGAAVVAGVAALAVVAPDARLIGGNAAALGLLAAWGVPQLLARRQGEDSETDGLGVVAFAAVLLALPLATQDANAVAGLAGALAGSVLGLALAPLRRG